MDNMPSIVNNVILQDFYWGNKTYEFPTVSGQFCSNFNQSESYF
jgi:hypothetical protein